MSTLKWSDELGNRSRLNKLLIIPPSGKPYWFAGGNNKDITVSTRRYTKNGKWSQWSYELVIADGVRAYPITQGWETGKWREGFCSTLGLSTTANWEEIAAKLGVDSTDLLRENPEKGPGKFLVIPDGPTHVDSEVD